MQIKRHWLLVETMPFEYFFSGVNTPASCSRQTAQATPKGLLRLHRALVWDIMCGQTGTRTEMDYEVCVAYRGEYGMGRLGTAGNFRETPHSRHLPKRSIKSNI